MKEPMQQISMHATKSLDLKRLSLLTITIIHITHTPRDERNIPLTYANDCETLNSDGPDVADVAAASSLITTRSTSTIQKYEFAPTVGIAPDTRHSQCSPFSPTGIHWSLHKYTQPVNSDTEPQI